MSKVFVHTFAVIVANDVLINTFDLRRRDDSDAVAFSYFAKRQQNYVDVEANDNALDATFYHTSDKKTFTRLVVIAQSDVKNACERCAALRGQDHAAYCDAELETSEVVSEDVAKKSALDLLQELKKNASASASVKKAANEASASDAKASDAKASEVKSAAKK